MLGGELLVRGLGLGLEEVFVFDSKSENRDRAVEAVEAVSEQFRVRVRVRCWEASSWYEAIF